MHMKEDIAGCNQKDSEQCGGGKRKIAEEFNDRPNTRSKTQQRSSDKKVKG